MGNPALTYLLDGKTPCHWCKYFGELVENPVHGTYVRCLYLRQPFWPYRTGCRHWEREPGADDDSPAGQPSEL
jgi:hypothetical protein